MKIQRIITAEGKTGVATKSIPSTQQQPTSLPISGDSTKSPTCR